MKRFATPLLALAIFLLNVWLNAPLFLPGELPFRGSIEGGYVGMARFVSEHPNPWGWNPFPYCGLPTQFMYVPGLPYVTALFMHLFPHASADSVYRVIVALMACAGPAALFFFALYFTKSRGWSFAMALAYSLLSPSYALFPAVEKDRGIVQLPWRIKVLAKYGEGPHNVGLTLLPLTLLAAWLAGKAGGYLRIVAAALLLAAIPLMNWVAALGLAISCLLLLLAAWGEPGFRAWRVLAAAALAYLLACFWLTPSFVKTIAFNWPVDSFGYQLRVKQLWLLAGMIAGVVSIRLLFRWLRGSFFFCFVTLGAFAFGWVATVYYLGHLDTIPESHRYAIEFELFFALAIFEALRLAMRSSNSTLRMCAMGSAGVMFVVIGVPQLWAYATQGWSAWLPTPAENTVEYRLAQWIALHPVEGRVFATGGLRFRLHSWFDIPQAGGAFDTGLRNRVPLDLAYRIRVGANLWRGRETEDTLLSLKALGAEYVVIHGPNSREFYRDFLHPERVTGSLPAVCHLEDDTIYALPRGPLAHLVSPDELPVSEVRGHPEALSRYVAALEDTSRPSLRVQWTDTSTLTITGPAPAGQLVAVQVNADPGWQATQDGHGIVTGQDKLGFIVLHVAPAAQTHIELRYRGTAEQRIMGVVSVLAWIGTLAAFVVRRW